VPYGDLMEVLETLRNGGFMKVALVALEGVGEATSNPASITDSQRR
jgi:hypothetical protein